MATAFACFGWEEVDPEAAIAGLGRSGRYFDADGDLFMLFEFMNSSSNPGVAYTARRVTLSPGVFHDGGIYLQSGVARTFDSRWGDFEATSYDGFSKDNVWFSGQYSAANGDWSTFIGRDNFCATCN